MKKILIAAAVAVAFTLSACSGASTPAPVAPAVSAPEASTPVAETPTPSDTPTEAPAPTYTKSQEQAIGAAEDYLGFMAFSRQGLIDQLSSKYGDGFSKKDATFAVDHLDVNWKEQAAQSANDYLDSGHFSCNGLIDQLQSPYGEQFTHAQAVYGAKKAGVC